MYKKLKFFIYSYSYIYYKYPATMTFECVSPPSTNIINRLLFDKSFSNSIGESEYDNNEQYYGCFNRMNNGSSSHYTKSNTISNSRTNVGFTTSINF